MTAPQHPTPVGENAPSILEQALEASIVEQIRVHVEHGTEDLARKYFGDEAVDEWFRADGWDVDAIRGEAVFALAEDLGPAIADRRMDALVQVARERHGREARRDAQTAGADRIFDLLDQADALDDARDEQWWADFNEDEAERRAA